MVHEQKQVVLTEERVRKILGTAIRADNCLEGHTAFGHWVYWLPNEDGIQLDGTFSIGELEAAIWWVKHHG